MKMPQKKPPNNFLFRFGTYSQRKCKPMLGAFLRLVTALAVTKIRILKAAFGKMEERYGKQRMHGPGFFQHERNIRE